MPGGAGRRLQQSGQPNGEREWLTTLVCSPSDLVDAADVYEKASESIGCCMTGGNVEAYNNCCFPAFLW